MGSDPAAFGLCFLTACASPTLTAPTLGVAEPGSGGTAVTIQVVGTLAEAPMYIAAERGYFAEQGISPQFVTLDSAAKAIPALATGQIDVAAGVLSAGLFNAVDGGLGIQVVAAQSENRGCARSSTWMLLRKDLADSSAVHSPADLRGRNIARADRFLVAA